MYILYEIPHPSPRRRFDPYAWRQICPCRRVIIISSLRNCQSIHLRSLATCTVSVRQTIRKWKKSAALQWCHNGALTRLCIYQTCYHNTTTSRWDWQIFIYPKTYCAKPVCAGSMHADVWALVHKPLCGRAMYVFKCWVWCLFLPVCRKWNR